MGERLGSQLKSLGVRAVAHPENIVEDLPCHIPIHLAMQH